MFKILENLLKENNMGLLSDEKLEWLVEEAKFLSKMAYTRQFAPFIRFDSAFKLTSNGRKYQKSSAQVKKWADNLVLDRKIELNRLKENNEPIPDVYIFNMLQKFEDLPMESVRNEFMNLLITGLDTLSGTSGFVILSLALHPELQEQVLQEDSEIRKEAGERELNVDDLKKYQLLERIIKETLRLFPGAPLIGRTLTEETLFGKHLVPKGTEIAALSLYAFRNPEIFHEPLKFNPDRFLPENIEKKHAYAYTPFSAGPRWCPGTKYAMLSIITYVTAIVREFTIGCQYSSFEEALNSVVAETTLTDVNGFPIKLTPRLKQL